MKFNRVTPGLLIFVLTILAMLMLYLALNTLFWDVVGECGSLCGGMMADQFIRSFSR